MRAAALLAGSVAAGRCMVAGCWFSGFVLIVARAASVGPWEKSERHELVHNGQTTFHLIDVEVDVTVGLHISIWHAGGSGPRPVLAKNATWP